MNIGECERLESLQRSAIRIICGAKIGTSHQGLYREVCVKKLSERRKESRLTKFWEIQGCHNDFRLNRQMLTTVQDRNPLARRRLEDFSLIKCRTVLFQNSYLLRTMKEWNDLPIPTRGCTTKTYFKNCVNRRIQKKYFTQIEVTRWASIIMSRIRSGNADLNANIFTRCLKTSLECACGATRETTKRYFLACPLFDSQREKNSQITKCPLFQHW